MKIVFMGTPEFSVPVLEKLTREHEIVAVYTREPKQSGRGKRLNKTPVHLLAESKNIPVHTPKSLKSPEEQEILKGYGADLAVVAAYGMLLPQAVLDMFPLGCINVHASLLPRWRGAAPIERAVESCDSKSGISIMQMAPALDAGDVLSRQEVVITPVMTGGELHDALKNIGADLLVETLHRLDTITPQKQDESLVCYAQKINKDELLLNFNEKAEVVNARIRAFAPQPGMYFVYKDERFKILKATVVANSGKSGEILVADNELVIAVQDKALKIEIIQRAGKQPMLTAELLRGFKFETGTIL